MSDYFTRLKEFGRKKVLNNQLTTELPKIPFDTFDTFTQAQIKKKSLIQFDVHKKIFLFLHTEAVPKVSKGTSGTFDTTFQVGNQKNIALIQS